MNKHLPNLLALPVLAALGCEAPELPPTAQAPSAAPAAEPPKEEPPMVAGAPGKELPETEVPVTDIPRKFLANDPVQGRRSRREAQQGTNVLGIGSTVAAGMYAKHQSIILAIDQALALYVPQHDFEYPKTQEEFMKDVVALALNGVPLPKLQEDHEYCYVPSQPEAGLQIRLVPGSPKSRVPAGTTPEQAIEMLAGGEQGAEQPAVEQPAAEPTEEEPSPDIRTRAAQVGEQGNKKIEEHVLAPGGLAPVGGLGEDEF
jgi:hypothetical protein